jgi:DNA-directed RNA polymerase I and III subunit RPAC2
MFFFLSLDKSNAIDALKTGLQDLYDLVAHVREAYAEDLAKKEYAEFEEVA